MHSHERFDALVVGAGPAGSVAALVLARGGARVALVDKARFPRDKACGDLVGPRGLQVLADLGIEEPSSCRVGDMIVMWPTGRSVRLPSFPGRTYPDHAMAMPRARFDAIPAHVASWRGLGGRRGFSRWPLPPTPRRLLHHRQTTRSGPASPPRRSGTALRGPP
jgi:choline dehydrogenase-like flavoprotein